jgi:FkbM family methyltransferase
MDEITFHTALHRPGTILDVGAHDGLLTLPLSRLPGARVLAFEPLPSAFARLRAAVLAEYGAIPPHVELRTEALGAAPGRLALSVPVLDGVVQEQWASLAKDYGGFASVRAESHEVAVVTVDSLGLADLQHVKVDAEGYEEEVLQGARATLTRCRPVLSLEVEERHRGGATRDVPALLASLGYETRFWLGGAMRELAEFDAATMQVASPDPAVFGASDPYVFTFYAWPVERAAEVLTRLDGRRNE